MCAVTHLYVCHDSFICVPWLIHMCAMTHSYVCHDSFICVPWLIHMCAMTHSYVKVLSCLDCLHFHVMLHLKRAAPYQWVMSHVSTSHVTHMNGSCDTYEGGMSHMWKSNVTDMTGASHTFICVISHIHMRHVTHSYASCHTFICVMSHIHMRHVTHSYASCHSYERVVWHVWISQVTRMTESRHTYVKSMSGVTRTTGSWETRHVQSNLHMSMKARVERDRKTWNETQNKEVSAQLEVEVFGGNDTWCAHVHTYVMIPEVRTYTHAMLYMRCTHAHIHTYIHTHIHPYTQTSWYLNCAHTLIWCYLRCTHTWYLRCTHTIHMMIPEVSTSTKQGIMSLIEHLHRNTWVHLLPVTCPIVLLVDMCDMT